MKKAASAAFSPEAARRAVEFVGYLKHTKSPWKGVPFRLLEYQQKRLIEPMFGTLVPNPRYPAISQREHIRRYRKVFNAIGKKNGKSELAAAIGCVLLYADGEYGAEVYSGASSRDQATIIYRVMRSMAEQVPELRKISKFYDSTKRIYVPSTESFYQALSADADYSDGINPSGVIVDELHRHKNRELYDLLNEGSGTREQPLTVVITTAGVDQSSVCYEEWLYARRVAEDPAMDPTFLPVIFELPNTKDGKRHAFDEVAKDERLWYFANPALGEFLDIEDLRKSVREAKEKPAKQLSVMRLRFNEWTQAEVAWFGPGAWSACGADLLTAIEGRNCGRVAFGGIDLSSTQDFAGWRLVFPWDSGQEYDTTGVCFLPEATAQKRESRLGELMAWKNGGYLELTPGDVIDYEFIKKRIRADAERYEIKEIGYDPWNATQIAVDLQNEGFTMVPVRQGFSTLSSPSKLLESLVARKNLHHGGDPLLAWMAGNAMIETDAAENIKPSKKKSTERIDGIVALVIALERAMHQTPEAQAVFY